MRIPYYIAHLFIAVAAMILVSTIAPLLPNPLVFSGMCTGLSIYISREIRDLEKLGFMDWPGLLWPAFGCIILYLISII